MEFPSSAAIATFQVLSSHAELVATALGSAHREHLQHHGNVYWTALERPADAEKREKETERERGRKKKQRNETLDITHVLWGNEEIKTKKEKQR